MKPLSWIFLTLALVTTVLLATSLLGKSFGVVTAEELGSVALVNIASYVAAAVIKYFSNE